MSTGLLWLHCSGRIASKAFIVSGRQLGQLTAARDQRIGGQHTRSAGVGDNRQPLCPRGRGCLASTSDM